jgi:hypothetical protein
MTSAHCREGAWRVTVARCDSPPPPKQVEDGGMEVSDAEAGAPATCPAMAPSPGTECALPAGEKCGYGDCAGTPSTLASCTEGTWRISSVPCNPPSPQP